MTLLCCELSTRCAISSLFLKVAIFTPALDLVFFCFFHLSFFWRGRLWDVNPITAQSDRNQRLLSAQIWASSEPLLGFSTHNAGDQYYATHTLLFAINNLHGLSFFFTVLWPNRKMTDIAFWYLHQMIRMGEIPEWASLLWQWQNTQKLNFWRPNRDLEIFPSSINLHSVTHCFT